VSSVISFTHNVAWPHAALRAFAGSL